MPAFVGGGLLVGKIRQLGEGDVFRGSLHSSVAYRFNVAFQAFPHPDSAGLRRQNTMPLVFLQQAKHLLQAARARGADTALRNL